VPDQALQHVEVPDAAVDRAAVGEVLAPPGTEVAEGVVAAPAEAPPAEPVSMDPTPRSDEEPGR
jgi:hypothetical protein